MLILESASEPLNTKCFQSLCGLANGKIWLAKAPAIFDRGKFPSKFYPHRASTSVWSSSLGGTICQSPPRCLPTEVCPLLNSRPMIFSSVVIVLLTARLALLPTTIITDWYVRCLLHFRCILAYCLLSELFYAIRSRKSSMQ